MEGQYYCISFYVYWYFSAENNPIQRTGSSTATYYLKFVPQTPFKGKKIRSHGYKVGAMSAFRELESTLVSWERWKRLEQTVCFINEHYLALIN